VGRIFDMSGEATGGIVCVAQSRQLRARRRDMNVDGSAA
jgi:hypothetical protein